MCARRWTAVWGALCQVIAGLRGKGAFEEAAWDLILLGRHRFGEDALVDGEHDIVQAGFSTCLHAYAVSERGARRLLWVSLGGAALHSTHRKLGSEQGPGTRGGNGWNSGREALLCRTNGAIGTISAPKPDFEAATAPDFEIQTRRAELRLTPSFAR